MFSMGRKNSRECQRHKSRMLKVAENKKLILVIISIKSSFKKHSHCHFHCHCQLLIAIITYLGICGTFPSRLPSRALVQWCSQCPSPFPWMVMNINLLTISILTEAHLYVSQVSSRVLLWSSTASVSTRESFTSLSKSSWKSWNKDLVILFVFKVTNCTNCRFVIEYSMLMFQVYV